MKLLSVNVGLPQALDHGGRRVSSGRVFSGIVKEPVPGRVRVGTLNLEGDGQADLEAHGGVYKAVYLYPSEHYPFWQEELGEGGYPMGRFGENFTSEGEELLEDAVNVGDRFRIGGVLLEVTQPRVPCFKLGIHMGRNDFPKRFLQSGRTGYYLKVLQEGHVEAGEPIERIRVDPAAMSVREINRLLYFDKTNLEGARQALKIEALSPGWRDDFEKRVAALARG